jgi:predicted phage terminase large subunit-like protein
VCGANRYIKDSVHERLDLPGTIAAVRRMAGLHPKAFTKLVEDKANGPAVMQSLKHEISGLTEVNPQGTKVGRATAATPELRAGNWFLPHPLIAPWVGNPENPTEAGFLAETIAFPLGDHDDWVDAWSMAANWIQSESGNRILTASEKDIRIEPLEIGAKWPRLYGLSVTWNEVGAVWLCRRPETGEHFLYAEHAAPAGDPARHAAEILKQGDWIPGFMHASSQGRDEKDGQALATKYRQMGLKHLMTVMDNTITEIADMQDALRSGKLKVCGDMARFFDQLRMFRRENSTRGDASGKLPTYNAGVVYAALVAWKHREKAKAPIEAPPPRETQYRNGPASQTWMG